VQLQEDIAKFEAAGLGIVLVTYDAPALQSAFVEKYEIEYPVISDKDAHTVTALGILNEENAPGDPAYGIPYPGIFVLGTDMRVKAKVFVEAYAQRVNSQAVLEIATNALGL